MRKYAPLFFVCVLEIWRTGLWEIVWVGGAKMDRTGEWMSEDGESSSPAVIWWISTDTHTHIVDFFLPSRQFKPKSCLTRHFWLIFYISPLIQIKKASALSLSSLQFSDVKKKRKKKEVSVSPAGCRAAAPWPVLLLLLLHLPTVTPTAAAALFSKGIRLACN